MKIYHRWTVEEAKTRNCSCRVFGDTYKITHTDKNDLLHCDKGPAVVYKSHGFAFYHHGNKHRTDGPSEYDPTPKYHKTWYDVDGKTLSQKQFAEFYLITHLKEYDFTEEKELGWPWI